MSQENVENVRRGIAAFNAGDWDTIRTLNDPNVTLRPAEGFVEPGPFLGREAVIRWSEQARETWPAGHLFTLRDGLVVRWEVLEGPGEALKAVGLEE